MKTDQEHREAVEAAIMALVMATGDAVAAGLRVHYEVIEGGPRGSTFIWFPQFGPVVDVVRPIVKPETPPGAELKLVG